MENCNSFTCPLCGNDNPRYIGYLKGRPYCRRCISFRGEEVKEDLTYPKSAPTYIDYDLSEEQNVLAKKLLENYKNNLNTLVHAVCGSGKTEITLEVIKYAIRCGDKVGFAIPRKDVVIELADRLSMIFKKNKVISLYGGHIKETSGDLIVLTTHQLYRYYHYFDLLIVDEIDAFPFNNNEVLNAFFFRAVKGHYILMSATPDKRIVSLFKNDGYMMVELFSRFHRYPLPVPQIIKGNNLYLFFKLISFLKRFIKLNKPIMVFVPTIELAESLYFKLNGLIAKGTCVHSLKKDRDNIILDFKKNKYRYIVTTAVLERGVTFKDAQVIVYHADHMIYNQHTLVQIAGRVGRKYNAPEGEVFFLVNEENEEINKAINDIVRANKNLQNLL